MGNAGGAPELPAPVFPDPSRATGGKHGHGKTGSKYRRSSKRGHGTAHPATGNAIFRTSGIWSSADTDDDFEACSRNACPGAYRLSRRFWLCPDSG